MSSGIQHRCMGDVDLDPAGCSIIQADRALNLYRVVDLRTMTVEGGGRRHALDVPGAVANDHECSFGERPETDDPTSDYDRRARSFREFSDERSSDSRHNNQSFPDCWNGELRSAAAVPSSFRPGEGGAHFVQYRRTDVLPY